MKSAGRNKRRRAGSPAGTTPTIPSALEAETRLRAAQVMVVTGWMRSKLYAEIRAGRFPAPERDGTRCSRWRLGTVLQAMQARTAS